MRNIKTNPTIILSPHRSIRGKYKIGGAVIHYTAGGSARSSAEWFANPGSKVSAHYVIGRDGHIYSCVPVKEKAWHAGSSLMSYAGLRNQNVNSFTLGFELANVGLLTKTKNEFAVLIDEVWE